jgi:hypothetical protein
MLNFIFILSIALMFVAFIVLAISGQSQSSSKNDWGLIIGIILIFSSIGTAFYGIIYENRHRGEHYTYLSPQSYRSYSSPEHYYRNDFYIGM